MRYKVRVERRLVPVSEGAECTLTGRFKATLGGQGFVWEPYYKAEHPVLFGLLPHWKQKLCKRRAWRAYLQRRKRERNELRQTWAKSAKFMEAFGGGGRLLQQGRQLGKTLQPVHLDDDTAKKTIDAYMKAYPGISKYKLQVAGGKP